MAEAKPKRQPPKIADITKPGKSAPSSTGRPMIITHRPVLKDPMMVQDVAAPEEGGDSTDTKPVAHMSHSIKLQPLHDDIADATTPGAPDVGSGKTIAVLAEEAAKRKEAKDKEQQEPEESPEAEEPASETALEPIEPTGAPAVEAEKIAVTESKTVTESIAPAPEVEAPTAETPHDSVAEAKDDDTEEPTKAAGEATAEKPTAPEPTEDIPLGEDAASSSIADAPSDTNLSETAQREALAAQKRADEQEEIITSGKYYLPINAVAHRRTKRHILLGVVLILLLAIVLFLAVWDANFFSVPGYTAPTDYL